MYRSAPFVPKGFYKSIIDGRILLNILPYLSFTLYAPQEYLSRAYHDAPKYCASIETTQVKNSEVIFTGEIPARCVQEYRNDLTFYTNGA